jgi:hypothetical protein
MKLRQSSTGFGSQCPPDEKYVRVYFLQQGASLVEAERFLSHYNGKRWQNAHSKALKNWKRFAWTWIWNRMSRNECNV